MIKYFVAVLCVQKLIISTPVVQPGKLLSYAIPENRALKKALGYNEDVYLNFTELCNKYGYSSEQHTIITEDDYILTAFRIIPKCFRLQKYPVLLAHGISDSSDSWIFPGPKNSLGYILSDNCYDAWAINLRGNTYSRKHLTLDPDKDPEYWEFSFDETGYFDLPATIDYILRITGSNKVYYVGHSQGTTNFFIMGSLRPEYNNKVNLAFHLAPVAGLKNLKSPLLKFIAQHTNPIKDFLENAGYGEIFGKQQLLHFIVEFLSQNFPDLVIGTALSVSTGYKQGSISSRNLALTSGHLIAGISVKSLAHFGQLVMSGNFQRYDEGRAGNIIRYGTSDPPKYNISLVTSPTVLICAESDWISTLEDMRILGSQLPNLVETYVVPVSTWSHNNHVWGINAGEYVFKVILNYIHLFDTK